VGKLINFKANPRPSALLRRMLEHRGDVSEGTLHKIIAKRQLLGKTIIFYNSGLRLIEGIDLTEQEQYDSEILRLAHASVLINGPVGDKKVCYVDATKNKVEVWVYGLRLEEFIERSKIAVRLGHLNVDQLLNEPVKDTTRLRNERDVKLFGR
jgi:hypothetical protein